MGVSANSDVGALAPVSSTKDDCGVVGAVNANVFSGAVGDSNSGIDEVTAAAAPGAIVIGPAVTIGAVPDAIVNVVCDGAGCDNVSCPPGTVVGSNSELDAAGATDDDTYGDGESNDPCCVVMGIIDGDVGCDTVSWLPGAIVGSNSELDAAGATDDDTYGDGESNDESTDPCCVVIVGIIDGAICDGAGCDNVSCPPGTVVGSNSELDAVGATDDDTYGDGESNDESNDPCCIDGAICGDVGAAVGVSNDVGAVGASSPAVDGAVGVVMYGDTETEPDGNADGASIGLVGAVGTSNDVGAVGASADVGVIDDAMYGDAVTCPVVGVGANNGSVTGVVVGVVVAALFASCLAAFSVVSTTAPPVMTFPGSRVAVGAVDGTIDGDNCGDGVVGANNGSVTGVSEVDGTTDGDSCDDGTLSIISAPK